MNSSKCSAETAQRLNDCIAHAYSHGVPRETIQAAERVLEDLRNESKKIHRASEAHEKALGFAVESELPEMPSAPNTLPVFENYKDVYGSPEILYAHGLLVLLLSDALGIMHKIVERALDVWSFNEDAGDKTIYDKKAENSRKGYEVARGCIDNDEHLEFSMFSALAQAILTMVKDYISKIEEITDPVEKLSCMYAQAIHAKRHLFDDLTGCIAAEIGIAFQPAPIKALVRLAEKYVLRPNSGLIWDPIRGMFVGKLGELAEVLRKLIEKAQAGEIIFVGCNDRFTTPTAENWQDAAVYIMFTDPQCNGIVAEIQLVHPRFKEIRENFGAHTAYDDLRFAAEIQKLKSARAVKCLPDSQRRTLLAATAS